ncbi:MAG: exo-alpha-sialidase [Pseudomonadota bacterium]
MLAIPPVLESHLRLLLIPSLASALLCATITLAAGDDGPVDAVALLPTPASAMSAQPHLAGVGDTLVLSWLEPDPAGGKVLRQAVMDDAGWETRPAVAAGRRWFVNWADFPSVVPIDDQGLWAAHWLQRRPGGRYSYDVFLSLSQDAGQTWSAPLIAHTDDTATEHGFVSLFPWDGVVGALWLDGRYTGGDHHQHGAAQSDRSQARGMTLRAGRFSPLGERLQAVEVDDLVCDCCQTDVTVSSAGPVAAYRNRTLDELRDIHIARLVNGRWTVGGPVGTRRWQVRGCPVNGPAIDADGDRVAVAWYSGADDEPRVSVAWSADAGAHFGPAVTIDARSPLGRVDVSLLNTVPGALVSWLGRGSDGEAGQRAQISVRFVGEDGRVGPILPLVQTLAARPSGFPQLALWREQLVLAWTDAEAERVRSARVPLAALLPRALGEGVPAD